MKALERVCILILIVLLVLSLCLSPALASTAGHDLSGKTESTAQCNSTSDNDVWHKTMIISLYSYINCIDQAVFKLTSDDIFARISQNKENINDIPPYDEKQGIPYDEGDGYEPGMTEDPGTAGNNHESASSENIFVAEVIRLVNEERAAAGLSPLSESRVLDEAAYVRCGEIMTVFSHTRPDGSSCFTALQEAGAVYRRAGENIAIGQSTPAQVVQAWMDSPGHRTNIMNEGFRYIGVSAFPASGDYGGYAWVQVFTD